ncbi:hypothetical protein QE152_g19013 [Popillia japonica]|uniref:Uncharacterized protein n=1 Tax=Popillia japonica TaxID=7064 RepID=A0AAW1L2Y4_POPJA
MIAETKKTRSLRSSGALPELSADRTPNKTTHQDPKRSFRPPQKRRLQQALQTKKDITGWTRMENTSPKMNYRLIRRDRGTEMEELARDGDAGP